MTASPPRARYHHPDRRGEARWAHVALVAASAVALGVAGQTAARGRVSPLVGLGLGVALAVAATAGLRSVSIRLASRLVLLFSAVLMIRFGVLTGAITGGGQALLVWLVSAVVVLVVTDRLGTEVNPGIDDADATPRRGLGATARTALVVSTVVVLVAVLLTPMLLPHLGASARTGSGPRLGQDDGSTSLNSSDRLDMTRRPELTDEVLFTVESPAATFWRGETFDRWDGRSWTRTDNRVNRLGPGGTVRPGPDDLAATGPDELVQRFRVRAGYAEVVYAAATASSVDIDGFAGQRGDATLVSAPLGRGATYTVVSRRIPLTAARLRAADGPVPEEIRARYAQPPVATDRVRAAATQVTRDAATPYDQIVALEAWMGRRTEYSLDAPLAPPGVDVVDHFLFESRQGWCEQVASSLVVLARANGLPARLVTGFVPDERDPVTGTFTVRARDAHSWAEVWFPRVGWVPFDPTAEVPLAGNDRPRSTAGQWLADHAVLLVLGLVGGGLAAGTLRLLVRHWRRRRRQRPATWATSADARLVQLGERAGRPRLPGESATAYGEALALRYLDPRLGVVGRTIDDAFYAPVEPVEHRRRGVDAVLAQLTDAGVPEAPPAGPAGARAREPVP